MVFMALSDNHRYHSQVFPNCTSLPKEISLPLWFGKTFFFFTVASLLFVSFFHQVQGLNHGLYSTTSEKKMYFQNIIIILELHAALSGDRACYMIKYIS